MTLRNERRPPSRRSISTAYSIQKLICTLCLILVLSTRAAAVASSSLTKPHGLTSIRRKANGLKQAHSKTTTTTTFQLDALSVRGGSNKAWVVGLKNSLASALAAGCSKAILAPFDTIKTMQQQYRSTGVSASLGFMEAAKLVMSRQGGFWELYAGLGVSVLGSMPSVGLYFGVYSYSKRTLGPALKKSFGSESDNPILSDSALMTLTVAASAAIGNTVASFSRVPYEVVKQKLQTGQYSSTWQALTQMAKTGGIRAFFPMGGVSIQMIRDIPYAMVTLLTYEYLRNHFPKSGNVPLPLLDMGAGALAGGIGSYITNPLDVIKTRLQTDPQVYSGSIRTCFAQTWQEGGPQAFLRGSVPRLLHKVPANGFFFVFYELFRRLLQVEGATTSAK